MKTIFRAFAKSTDCASELNQGINTFIDMWEAEGFCVAHKTVHVEHHDHGPIKPQIVITVWMERDETELEQ